MKKQYDLWCHLQANNAWVWHEFFHYGASTGRPKHRRQRSRMSDYNEEKAYARWRGQMGDCLKEARALFAKRPLVCLPDADLLKDNTRSLFTKMIVLNRGRLVWGCFARAFWPAYVPGARNHYGTVLLSFDPSFEDSPGLFRLSKELRELRNSDAEPVGFGRFCRIIRDDHHGPNRVRVPAQLTGGKIVYYQSICIQRKRLPIGYLHHRLVPVLALPTIRYCMILPLRFWSARLREIWQFGEPLLDAQEINHYQRAFPVVP